MRITIGLAALAGAASLAACGGGGNGEQGQGGADSAAAGGAETSTQAGGAAQDGASAAGTRAQAGGPTAAGEQGSLQYPQIRPGQWRVTMSMPGVPQPITSEQCITPEQAASREAFEPSGDQTCTNVSMRREGAAYVAHAECRSEAGSVVLDQRITGDFQNSYRMESTMRMDPAPPGGGPQQMVIEGRRMGECTSN